MLKPIKKLFVAPKYACTYLNSCREFNVVVMQYFISQRYERSPILVASSYLCGPSRLESNSQICVILPERGANSSGGMQLPDRGC